MSDGTKIEWTDATWNPITGCSVVSPGCTNCYAMRLAGTRLRHHPTRAGLTRDSKAGPVWTGEVRFNEAALDQPLRWRRSRMIFVCAHGDLFAEGVPDAWIDRIFAVMALCPQHIFQVLTKRPERMRDYVSLMSTRWVLRLSQAINNSGDAAIEAADRPGRPMPRWPLPNAWLGVSVEDQRRADERIPVLLDTPAAVRWISAEPLLGPVDFNRISRKDPKPPHNAWTESALYGCVTPWAEGQSLADLAGAMPRLDWIVAGGESGPGARPMHPDWARSLRDQCAAAGVPFLFKQWGEWAPGECSAGPPTRTEDAATWFDGRWSFERITPSASEGMHIDDEPDVYRLGKKAAGRLLDGRTHDGFPLQNSEARHDHAA